MKKSLVKNCLVKKNSGQQEFLVKIYTSEKKWFKKNLDPKKSGENKYL